MTLKHVLVVCSILAVASSRASSPAAASPPSATTILAQAKAAAGANALDAVRTLHLDETVNLAGATGAGREYDDLVQGRFAQFADLGPLSGGQGFDGVRPWMQDASGDAWPVGDRVSAHQASSASFMTSLSFWYPSRRPGHVEYRGTAQDDHGRYDVVRAFPQGGFPVDIWVDSQTHLIRKEVTRIPYGRDTILELGDYRNVGDVVLPFAMRTIANGNTIQTHVTRVAINTDVSPHLAMPDVRLHDAAISGGSSTTIPFELVNNHIFIHVKIDGKGPYRFFFDTGGQNVVTPDVAARLGITVNGAVQVSGAGKNTVTSGFAWVPQVQIGAASLHHQAFAVFPIGAILHAVEGEKIDGIVGVEVARRFLTTIDYQRHLMTLSERTRTTDFAGQPIPFVYDQSVPLIAGNANGLAGHFIIDTGNRVSLVLYAPFVQAHDLQVIYPSKVKGITGFGIGGPSMGQLVRLGTVTIGFMKIHNVVTSLSLDTSGAFTDPGVSGNIGGGILKRFTVSFDYQKQLMYLQPNDAFAAKENYDRSGLFLIQTSAGLKVMSALPNTPAFTAGIRGGDLIESVNGKPASAIGLLGVRALLRGESGTPVEMTVHSGDSARKVTFALRDYV
jgi:hypothetical protein